MHRPDDLVIRGAPAGRASPPLGLRAALFLLLLVTTGCGKLVGDVGARAAEVAATTVERLFTSGEGRLAGTAARQFNLEGELVVGRMMTFGERKLLVKEADAAVTRRVEAVLGRTVVGKPQALAMLHQLGDRPILRRVKAGWPEDQYTEGVLTEPGLRAFMGAHRGERVIAFGHIEGSSPATAEFVAYGGGEAVRVPVAALLALAREAHVQLTIVGCRSYKAGAPAGPYFDLQGEALPAILSAMRQARTYGEFVAAIGTPDRPVIVDPAAFSTDVRAGILAYRIAGAKKIAMSQSLRPAANGIEEAMGLENALPAAPAAPTRSPLDLAVILLLIGVPAIIWCVLLPLGELLGALGPAAARRSGDRIRRMVAALERRVRMTDEVRRMIRLILVLSACVIAFTRATEAGVGADVIAAMALVALNLAGGAAARRQRRQET